MITNSFILLDKVGVKKEQDIWAQNVRNWNAFLNASTVKGISDTRKQAYNNEIHRIKEALWNENYQAIIRRMPNTDRWRLFDLFQDEACYLDIETTGYHGDITVIGVYDGRESHFFIKEQSLDRQRFIKLMERYKMIVTFNGASFDLPVIEKQLRVRLPHVHVDLRHVGAKLGYVGGLKKIEEQLGIVRGEESQGVDGLEAVRLWYKWVDTREQHYLKTLIAYNEEDIVNLEPLAKRFVKELWAQTFNHPSCNAPTLQTHHANYAPSSNQHVQPPR